MFHFYKWNKEISISTSKICLINTIPTYNLIIIVLVQWFFGVVKKYKPSALRTHVKNKAPFDNKLIKFNFEF